MRTRYFAILLGLNLALMACTTQAQVQLYGTVDASVGTVSAQPPGAPNAPITKTTGVHSGTLQTSYFGMRGSEDLGGGLTASFVLESFFRVDNGASGRFDGNPTSAGDLMWSRQAVVGLAGPWGEVRLGSNDNPMFVTMLLTNAMGTNSTFSPSFRQLFNTGARGVLEADTTIVNSVRYTSPRLGGVEFNVEGSPDEGRGSPNYAANVIYVDGPLLLSAATQHVGYAPPPASTTLLVAPFMPLDTRRDQTTHMLGGAYGVGPVRVFGQYARVRNDRTGTTDKMPDVGVTACWGNGELQMAVGQDKTSGSLTARRTTSTLGYVYDLSKRTALYAFAMADRVSAGTAKSYVVGVRHRF
ncbi:porin [Variovorax ginsengisoli]|uniref:Porin n=1 Tax=Variovorax ginsengisoli TaxID=363844 RepID=A0ABT9SDN5_9BURK|nr:porin [Variovorax ginsengisoli]MDP9902459.1 putative porin [Variovorax ginsengisoli]